MIYAIISQVVMLLTNLSILINNKMSLDFYKIYYMSLPVILYTVFYVMFYISHWKMQVQSDNYLINSFIIMVALFINVFYCVVETIIDQPDNPWLFYICTTFIQLINILFLFNLVRKTASEISRPAELIVMQIFSYIFLFLSAYSMYAIVFINVYITVISMLATSAFSTVVMFMYLIAVRKRLAYEKNSLKNPGSSEYEDYYDDDFENEDQ